MKIENMKCYRKDLINLLENEGYETFEEGCKLLGSITECTVIPNLVEELGHPYHKTIFLLEDNNGSRNVVFQTFEHGILIDEFTV